MTSLKGRKQSPEHVAKRAAAKRGKKHTPEAIARMRAAQQNRPPPSAKTKAKTSAALKKYYESPEARAKNSAAHKKRYAERPMSNETKKKIGAAHRGRKHTAKSRANMSAAGKRRIAREDAAGIKRTRSPETRAKLAASVRAWHATHASPTKGRKHTDEARAKMSASHKGKKLSPEHCAKISALKRGVKPSAETRAKTSAASKRWHASMTAEEKKSYRAKTRRRHGPSGPERIMQKMLEDRGVRYAFEEPIVDAFGRSRSADFLVGIVDIEVNGTYPHADPQKYHAHDRIYGELAKDIWAEDAKRTAGLQLAGYKVLVIWQRELEEDPEGVWEKVSRFLDEQV